MARRRQRDGFRFLGPFPTYSRRTRGGGRFSVGGCCLPTFALMAMSAAGAARMAFEAGRAAAAGNRRS